MGSHKAVVVMVMLALIKISLVTCESDESLAEQYETAPDKAAQHENMENMLAEMVAKDIMANQNLESYETPDHIKTHFANYITKRFSEFLGGKRFSEFLGGKRDAKRFSEFLGGKRDAKRFSEFLGGKKRFSEFLGGKKRFSEFLGGKKRDEKRFSEFLGGKKRFSEFLGGKKRFSEFLGGKKRFSEFLGGKKRFSEFLGGKRNAMSADPDQDVLPMLRQADYHSSR